MMKKPARTCPTAVPTSVTWLSAAAASPNVPVIAFWARSM